MYFENVTVDEHDAYLMNFLLFLVRLLMIEKLKSKIKSLNMITVVHFLLMLDVNVKEWNFLNLFFFLKLNFFLTVFAMKD